MEKPYASDHYKKGDSELPVNAVRPPKHFHIGQVSIADSRGCGSGGSNPGDPTWPSGIAGRPVDPASQIWESSLFAQLSPCCCSAAGEGESIFAEPAFLLKFLTLSGFVVRVWFLGYVVQSTMVRSPNFHRPDIIDQADAVLATSQVPDSAYLLRRRQRHCCHMSRGPKRD